MAFLKKSGRLASSKSKVSSAATADSDLPADWMAPQGSSSSSSSSSSSQDAAAARKRREEAEAEAEADRRRLLNVNRYAAGGGGGGGAAAFTKIRKQEQSRVEKMQNQTFTRWVNLQLAQRSGSRPMLDLVQGLASGENLLRLLSVLSGKNPSASAQGTSTSSLSASVASGSKEVGARRANQPNLGGVGSRFQSLGNVEQAFKFMKEEGIPLIGIGPQDISQGNLKLILGMMWSIIQHYRLVNLFDNEQQATQEKTSTLPSSPSSTQSTSATNKKSDAGEVMVKEAAKKQEEEGKAADVAVNGGSAKALDAPPANGAAGSSTGAAAAVPAAAVVVDEAVADDKGKKGKKDDKKKAKEDKKEQQAKEKERKKNEEEEKKAAKKEQQDNNKKAKASEALAARPDEAKQVGPSTSTAPVARSVQPQQQSVESSLLEWVREKITAAAPEGEKLHVGNVKELFADGRALPILVNAIQPGSVDVKALDIKRPVENNKLALRVATEKLAVPALIEGDDLANGADVDGLSLILYLSYLKQADAGKAQAKEAVVEVEKKQLKDDSKQGEDRNAQNATGAEVEAKEEVEKNEAKKDSESDAQVHEQPRKDEAEKMSAAETKVETRANTVVVAERKVELKAAVEAHAGPSAESEPATKRPPISAPSADSPVAATVAPREKSEDLGVQAQAIAKDVALPAASAAVEAKALSFDAAVKPSPAVVAKTVPDVTAAVAPNGAAEDTVKEAAVTAQAKDEGGEAAEPEEESEGGKKKKEKKEKSGKKKAKKSKKSKDEKKNDNDGGDEKSKKKKKLKKKTSSLAAKKTDEAVEQITSPTREATVASVPATSPSPKVAEASPAKKVIAPLPHSRLPARSGEDLSYLAGGSAPIKKAASLQLAAIPERKKPAPPPTVSADVDPVSAFWYS